jgi:predicted permease
MAVPQSAFFIKNNLGFVYKVVGYLAQMSTPFALLLVGAGLDFSHSVSNLKKLMSVVAAKNLVFPGVVMVVAYLTGLFNAVDFAVMISVFASPTAVSSAVMAAELGGDEDLANEIVIYTTMFSIISLLIIIYVLKTVGCL